LRNELQLWAIVEKPLRSGAFYDLCQIDFSPGIVFLRTALRQPTVANLSTNSQNPTSNQAATQTTHPPRPSSFCNPTSFLILPFLPNAFLTPS
jgi:hypothetical protein